MIAQISSGEGFGGLVSYANDILKKDTVIVASDGVSLTSNATITASFRQKPVPLSVSLSDTYHSVFHLMTRRNWMTKR